MQGQILNRDIVAEFIKDSSGRIRLNNLIVVVEERSSRDGKIYVTREFYDVDYSRQYGYIFHMSGCGGRGPLKVSGIYHVKGSTKIKEVETRLVDPKDSPPWKGARTLAIQKRNRTRRISKLPKPFNLAEGEDILDWLQDNGIEGDSVWCSICRDWYPGSDDWNLCEHCWWCDKTGNHSTPDERCDCKSRDECRDEGMCA